MLDWQCVANLELFSLASNHLIFNHRKVTQCNHFTIFQNSGVKASNASYNSHFAHFALCNFVFPLEAALACMLYAAT